MKKKISIKPILIELKASKIDPGRAGVFAVVNFKKGDFITGGPHKEVFQKNIVPWSQFRSFGKEAQKKILDFCIGTPTGFTLRNGMDFNTMGIDWFLNHSCEGNMGFSKKGDFIALRNIRKGEELTYDYGLAESNPKYRINCGCGSKRCRKIVTGNDWQNPEFRKAHHGHMLPFLPALD